ncbi:MULTISPECIES: MotY family protein [Vibrio]|uniref:MotY family protein n=1 Tax=Vibrio TaxID=662 RepID=UPI002075C425|nr:MULTISPECIES: OmpA family protein [Vibrio]USD31710.1 OmpA family protein [Vibrio sp. SCSIO 43186]USD44756.1 OmpA family protein [Vibrio sp. SCSIO 43145]USD68833.1 OmpA family protein [Vibrio sp. SCSIO 43139]USD96524.1 flagellar protein MotY [Vibrio coralliilyticus]
MNTKAQKIYLLALLFHCSSFADTEVEVPMDEVDWVYKGSSLVCNLEYEDSSYGKFYFRSEEVGNIYFHTQVEKNNKNWNSGKLYSYPAPWSNENELLLISQNTTINNQYSTFKHNMAELLNNMEAGHWIKFAFSGRNASDYRAYILPTIRIQTALTQFRRCQSSLPSMSYAQARNITLSFELGQRQLTTQQTNTLDALNTYLRADNNISKILIDGYTDNIGSKVANLTISKQRAELVAKALKKYGIEDARIEVRSHGSRYPIASNATPEGQAKNRRVTLRLVRNDEAVIPTKIRKINEMEKA